MKVSLYHVRKSDEHTNIIGGRTGTVYVTKEKLMELFGSPTVIFEPGDKVTFIYQFDTPRGPAHVRDYWWNGPEEHSIASSGPKANLWVKSFLRNHGLKTQ